MSVIDTTSLKSRYGPLRRVEYEYADMQHKLGVDIYYTTASHTDTLFFVSKVPSFATDPGLILSIYFEYWIKAET
jgi:hypothetical protein